MTKKIAILSLSGGMDSSTLLLKLLTEGFEVTCISFYYGQKHEVELHRASELVSYLRENNLPVRHHVIELLGLASLLQSSLVDGGDEVPEGHYEDENMKDTVVPNRNKIFSSIIQAIALSKLKSNPDSLVYIGMGIHAGDHAIYPDCRKEFRDADYMAFLLGNYDASAIIYYTPFLEMDKNGILAEGEICCKTLGVDFNEVYSRTITSYKPIFIPKDPESGSTLSPGTWYSDYKSASSVERIEAFIKLGKPDPAKYADETGEVPWEVAKEHVIKILER